MGVTKSIKHSSLLQYNKNFAIKRFIVQAPWVVSMYTVKGSIGH